MGDCHRPPKQAHEKIALEPVAMSLKNLMLLVVVAISMHSSTSSPTISFEAIGKEKDNVIQAFGGLARAKLGLVGGLAGAKLGLVKSLAAPKIAIASGLIGAKAGLAKGLLGAKLGLASAVLR